jgi:hypothetical protein
MRDIRQLIRPPQTKPTADFHFGRRPPDRSGRKHVSILTVALTDVSDLVAAIPAAGVDTALMLSTGMFALFALLPQRQFQT